MSKNVKKVIAIVAVTVVGALFIWLPLEEWILALAEYIRDAGSTGVIAFALVYVAAAVLFLPGSLITLAAGFAYGPFIGLAVVSPVSVLAATAAFLVGRYLARDWVAEKTRNASRFQAVDRAIAQNGFKVVFLLRLSPAFPFNFLNYALGLTNVSLGNYVLASFVGMLPGTFLFVYLGSLVTNAAQLTAESRPDAGVLGQLLFWGGLLATLAVTIMISRLAKRELDRSLQKANTGTSS